MIEGIYRAKFATPAGHGEGLVHVAGGKIGGGDSILYYTGTVSLTGDDFTASIRTGRHSTVPGSFPLFGKDNVRLELKGKVDGDKVTCTGSSPDAPGVSFSATLTKISD